MLAYILPKHYLIIASLSRKPSKGMKLPVIVHGDSAPISQSSPPDQPNDEVLDQMESVESGNMVSYIPNSVEDQKDWKYSETTFTFSSNDYEQGNYQDGPEDSVDYHTNQPFVAGIFVVDGH